MITAMKAVRFQLVHMPKAAHPNGHSFIEVRKYLKNGGFLQTHSLTPVALNSKPWIILNPTWRGRGLSK